MSAPDQKLIASLVAARAALDAALLELTKESSPAPPPPVPAAALGGGANCKHEHRKELAPTFGTSEHWVCEDCGFEYRR
jgi:hypothetical protein